MSYKTSAIAYFKVPEDIHIKRLQVGGGIFGQKHNFYIGEYLSQSG